MFALDRHISQKTSKTLILTDCVEDVNGNLVCIRYGNLRISASKSHYMAVYE